MKIFHEYMIYIAMVGMSFLLLSLVLTIISRVALRKRIVSINIYFHVIGGILLLLAGLISVIIQIIEIVIKA